MKRKFKKIMSVVASTFLIGSTIGLAAAAGGAFPLPFVKDSNADYALVYGANAATTDVVAANSIDAYLKTFYSVEESSTTSGDFSSSVSISDEIELGEDDILGSKLRAKLEDNKLSTLLDTKVDWDNGDGTESYDVHEEILLTDENDDSKLKLVTNLDHPNGEDLDSFVVLQNDESLRYRLVFDDYLEFYDKDDAKGLKVSILGKEYEITDFNEDFNEVTISLSEERVVKKGDVLNIEGVTLTIGEIFDYAVEVNGVLVKEEGSIKKINGLEVQVIDTASHSDSTLSKAVIRVGKDIKRDINTGDKYTKGDETWEWDIGINEGKQYIGVKYVLSNVAYDEDEPEENPISPGESYIFPENYAALSFEGLTNATYEDFDLSFDDKDLYEGEYKGNDINVAILEGKDDDSLTLTHDGNEIETDSIYFEYVNNGVKVYFKDIDGDVDSDKKGRIQFSKMYDFSQDTVVTTIEITEEDVTILTGDALIIGYEYNDSTTIHEVAKITLGETAYYIYYYGGNFMSVDMENVDTIYGDEPIIGYEYTEGEETYGVTYSEGIYTYEKEVPGTLIDKSYSVANLIVKDTEIDLGLDLNADKTVYLTLTNDGEVTKIPLGIDDGEFKHLGLRSEDADAGDIVVSNIDIGKKDYDVMDHYGTIIRNPEHNADNDRVILSIPSEQVFAKVSIKGQGEVIETTDETPQAGVMVVKDTEVESVQDKNLFIVGGSCINAEAARLLGGKSCGEEFTLKTGIVAGKALIQSFASPYNSEKVAVVVAGYHAEDTTRAANTVVNQNIDLAIGQKHIV